MVMPRTERRRVSCFVATLVLTVTIPLVAPDEAIPRASSDCRVLFIGAHGLNENESSPILADTWKSFHAYSENHGSYGKDKPKMLAYPKLGVWEFISALRANIENPNMSSLPAVNQGVELLDATVRGYLAQCPYGGGVVIAGYSEGAWIVDEYLRRNYGLSAAVKGVQLYGDPLYEDLNMGDQGLGRNFGFASNFPDPYPDSTLEGANIVDSQCMNMDPICGRGFRAADSSARSSQQLGAALRCAVKIDACKSHTESYLGLTVKRGGEFLAANSFNAD
ncbi:cutinase family protein [Streptomyces canus]|uniref:cutinase family protein n=1 Tax=Streptomyces canus TaxID=58343 RepID=UPI003AF3C122